MNTILVGLGSLVAGILIALIVTYFLPKEKIKTVNQALEKQEQQTRLSIKELENTYLKKEKELSDSFQKNSINYSNELDKVLNRIKKERQQWEDEKTVQTQKIREQTLKAKIDLNTINQEINDKKTSLEDLSKQAIKSAETIEQQALDNITHNVMIKQTELLKQYDELESHLKTQYITLADEERDKYLQENEYLSNQILLLEDKLNELRSKADAAAESNRKAELNSQAKNFYRLQLDEIDIEEIKKIRSIEPYLRNKEPLNKVIWKVYYEKPTTDLIARVLGYKVRTGIYKITNLENNLCYVGQCVNAAERWKQHIKRGIGAEQATRNKLYPAMLSFGVENFMFELIEDCEPAKLNEREDYWQEFYHAKEGYSIK